MQCSAALDAFRDHLRSEKRSSEHTLRAYLHDVTELGTFARGTAADVDRAVAAARAAQPAWAATPWQERLAIMRRAAEHISDHLMDDSAIIPVSPCSSIR